MLRILPPFVKTQNSHLLCESNSYFMITWELVELNFINLCIYVLFNYFVLMFLNLPSRLVETVAGNPPPISYTPTQPAPPLWRSKRPITVTSLPKLFNTATQITKVTVSRLEFLCFSFVGDKNSINAGDLFTRVRGGGIGRIQYV